MSDYSTDENPFGADHVVWNYAYYVCGAVIGISTCACLWLIIKCVKNGFTWRNRRRRVDVENSEPEFHQFRRDHVVIDMEGIFPETMEPSRITHDIETGNLDLLVYQMYQLHLAQTEGQASTSMDSPDNFLNNMEATNEGDPSKVRGHLQRSASMEIHHSKSVTVIHRSFSSIDLATEDDQELVNGNFSTSDEEDMGDFQTPSNNAENGESTNIQAKAENGKVSEDAVLEPPAKISNIKQEQELTSVTVDGDFGSSCSSNSICTAILNTKYVPRLDANMNEFTVYVMTTDEDETTSPPEGNMASNSAAADAATDRSTVDQVTATAGPSAAPAVQGATDVKKKPKSSTVGLQGILAGRVISEGEFEDATDTQEPASIIQRGQTFFRTDYLDYIQAEGGWERKKVGNYVLAPTHRVTSRRTDAMLGPNIFSTFLEPLNDLVSSLISPDGSDTNLEEPDEPPKLNFGEFEDSDQETIKEEMNRLTEPKNPGVISMLDFCQAEGSPHFQDTINENVVVSGQNNTVEAVILDDPTEMESGNASIPATPKLSSINNGIENDKSTERPTSSSIERATTASRLEIQTQGSSVTQAKPVAYRQSISIGGVPIELNINLTLNSCCQQHGESSGGGSPAQATTTMPTNAECTCGNLASAGIVPGRPPDVPASKIDRAETGKINCTCPTRNVGTDCPMCGSDPPEVRVHGVQTLLDFMQAEGSPCYDHSNVPGFGLNEIGTQLTAWWDTATHSLRNEPCGNEAENPGGLITISPPKTKKEREGGMEPGSAPEQLGMPDVEVGTTPTSAESGTSATDTETEKEKSEPEQDKPELEEAEDKDD